MRYLFIILSLFFVGNLHSQCSDTLVTDFVQFCEFTKDHQVLNECLTWDIDNRFIISDSTITKCGKQSLIVYDIAYSSQDSIVISYFIQDGPNILKIVKFKGLPILEMYKQYNSVSLGPIISRQTFINKKDFDEASKKFY